MNRSLAVGLAAAAVVVVALVGFQVFNGRDVVSPSPTESPSVAPSATPQPTPIGDAFPAAGELAVGRHAMTLDGVQVSLEVSTAGWTSNGDFLIDRHTGVTPDDAAILFWPIGVENVFSDPCAETLQRPPVGPTPDDLAAAMAAIPGTDLVSGPLDVSVGGYPAQRVVLAIREDIPCDPHGFFLWSCAELECWRYATSLGDKISVWIVDVNGKRIVIDTETYQGAGPEIGEEIQHIIDSIVFE